MWGARVVITIGLLASCGGASASDSKSPPILNLSGDEVVCFGTDTATDELRCRRSMFSFPVKEYARGRLNRIQLRTRSGEVRWLLGADVDFTGKAREFGAPAQAVPTARAIRANDQGAPADAQRVQRAVLTEIPHCPHKLGTLSITNGDDPRGWNQYNLAPPEKLLRVVVQRSGCFNLVDRGAGLNAAATERDIGGNLGLQRGSNVGQGQIKAADYVLVAEVQASNGNSGGTALGGIAGGLIGGRFGGLVGGIKTTKLEANTVLSLTNVRTTETVSVQDGYAVKNDVSFGAGGGLGGFGGAVGGGYENTDTGRVVTLAFLQAYNKMVGDLGLLERGGQAAAAPSRTFMVTGPLDLHKEPDTKSLVTRTLPAGSIVFPTGNKNGLWWEVADENDNRGWVLNSNLEPSP